MLLAAMSSVDGELGSRLNVKGVRVCVCVSERETHRDSERGNVCVCAGGLEIL